MKITHSPTAHSKLRRWLAARAASVSSRLQGAPPSADSTIEDLAQQILSTFNGSAPGLQHLLGVAVYMGPDGNCQVYQSLMVHKGGIPDRSAIARQFTDHLVDADPRLKTLQLIHRGAVPIAVPPSMSNHTGPADFEGALLTLFPHFQQESTTPPEFLRCLFLLSRQIETMLHNIPARRFQDGLALLQQPDCPPQPPHLASFLQWAQTVAGDETRGCTCPQCRAKSTPRQP